MSEYQLTPVDQLPPHDFMVLAGGESDGQKVYLIQSNVNQHQYVVLKDHLEALFQTVPGLSTKKCSALVQTTIRGWPSQ